jgi:hypothetical protein
MANPTNFIAMIPGRGNGGNRRSSYENDAIAIKSLLLEFSHVIKGSLPGDVAAGQSLAASIKAADVIVTGYEGTSGLISSLEALKIGYQPPRTPAEIAILTAHGGRVPISTSRITSAAMLNELNQFIDGYKSKYPMPAGYDAIKSKLTLDIGKLKNLMDKMRASWHTAAAAPSTPADTAAANTEPAKLKTKHKGKKGSVAKLKKKNR